MTGYRALRLDDVEAVPWPGGITWRPVRWALGLRAFGASGYTAAAAGDVVVEPHTEAGDGRGHEELYVVLRGRATSTLDGETVDAPAGTLVLVSVPAVHRAATAAEAGTDVVVLGGPPGFSPAGSEWVMRARPHLGSDPPVPAPSSRTACASCRAARRSRSGSRSSRLPRGGARRRSPPCGWPSRASRGCAARRRPTRVSRPCWRPLSPRERLTAICEALPEALASPAGDRHVAYTVRGRTFAYFLDDHHDDGRLALNCKSEPGENGALAAADPEHFFIPAYLGARGWVGVHLNRPGTDWNQVEALVIRSYRLIAPKRLGAQLGP